MESIGDRVDVHCPLEFFSSSSDRLRSNIIQTIISAICALLNGNGGRVVLITVVKHVSFSQKSSMIRVIEQTMISIIGSHLTISNISFENDQKKFEILVKKADSLVTTNYNLYLPSQTQVVQVLATEPLGKINDIINRKVLLQAIALGSHQKTFLKDENCAFEEHKTVQFKSLKSESSKRTTLADRITGKGNKFSCYVSAFANYNGGHIYYGINDDGVVEGQIIPSEKDKGEITEKVEKAINKIIWPKQVGQPKRGEHWEIFFEPVLDQNSIAIRSTFVIVVFIAACVGGVFTEEPECYEMVGGKVEKMSFASWKKRIPGPDGVLANELQCCGTEEGKVKKAIVTRNENSAPLCTCQQEIPRAPGSSITWLSTRTRRVCITAFCVLTLYLNNADWESFLEQSRVIEENNPGFVEIKLVVLLKKIVWRCRKHEFNKANCLLQKYEDLLPSCTEKRIFELLGLYAKAVLYRCRGYLDNSEGLLAKALGKAEWVIPGLVTAVINIFAGTITDRFDKNNCLHPPDVLSINALEHLKLFVDCPVIRADLEHKAHITLAAFSLGCNLSGQLVYDHVDDACLKQAEASVEAVQRSVNEGNILTRYRDSQFNLVKSILHFRYSENKYSKTLHLKKAFEFSKSAERLARQCKSDEVVSWSKSLQALYTEKLLRLQLSKLNPRRSPWTTRRSTA